MIDPKVYPDPPEPDRLAVGVRAVCGALLGLVLATVLWMRLGGLGPWSSLVEFSGVVAFCVCSAVKYGDSFWESLSTRSRPWDEL
jgi:hypothetical protein